MYKIIEFKTSPKLMNRMLKKQTTNNETTSQECVYELTSKIFLKQKIGETSRS